MKLWQKIFLSSLCLIIAAVNVISIVLLNNSHKLLIERERSHAINEYEYFAASFANTVVYERLKADKIMMSEEDIKKIAADIVSSRSQGQSAAAVYDSNKALIESSALPELFGLDEFLSYISGIGTSAGDYYIKIFKCGNIHYMTVCSTLKIEDNSYLILTASDVSEIYTLRSQQTDFVRKVSLISAAIISLILLVTIIFLLRPLSKLNTYTKAIAKGNYKIRIRKKGSHEFRELAENMNIMADSIQSHAARLEKIAEDRQTFIANLAHEMKTPLTSILGFADLLRIKRNVSDKERFEYANVIVEETKRLRSLSGKLMELIALGGTETDKKPVSLPSMIKETEAALTPILQKNSLSLACISEDITIYADEELFKSLLYNIIENAIKASSIGQQITLRAAMTSGSAVIAISDQGIGMSQEDAKKVFEPFYMVDKSRSRKAGGAGLGLALCVKIAELHNAILTIDSHLGQGTTVYIIVSGEECL
ncbi:MAG: HAMP domain-containing histidine kinase [Ruminococcus flavefaciens]|nr:HAMP domain-containing histidine kinase [Ruminococcus flavefaciens]MCM1361106.1 HAMP domain-containing histidine kinase [Clostridiales bacterium]MCM1434984.1 HAMP domain-containing histidine kinase [Ruminococcus flavefaciens]